MIQSLVLFLICFFVGVVDISETTYINTKNLSVSRNIKYDFSDALMSKGDDEKVGEITAVINDYSDEVFKNVQKYIIRSGLDPVELPNQSIKLFPTGTINLTTGWLEDTSTVARYNDVIVTYRSFTKRLTAVIPVKFNTLMFTYKYNTKVLFLNRTGNAAGKITNVKASISLSFDFDKYEATLDKFDITETGGISLTFSGNGMIDWITNTMTSVVSTFLHPIIIRIIQTMIKGGLNQAVKVINESIHDILHN